MILAFFALLLIGAVGLMWSALHAERKAHIEALKTTGEQLAANTRALDRLSDAILNARLISSAPDR